MRYAVALMGLAACLAGAAPARTEPAPSAAPPPVAEATGVIAYPAAFFASSRPNTALDMISRLPGFVLDGGDTGTRGLSNSAGNVLVDGARPATKSDTLYDVLQRISAASVERIELIRGGAPGIDMQGRSVVANVVLKRTSKGEVVVQATARAYADGAVGPSVKAEYARREGDRQTEASVSATTDASGITARGRRLRTAPDGMAIQSAGLDIVGRYAMLDLRGAIQRPLAGGKLHVNAVLTYTAAHDTQATTIVAGGGGDEFVAERSDYPSGELAFTWTRNLGARSEFELTGQQRLNRFGYDGAFASAGGGGSSFSSTATRGESVVRGIHRFRPNARLAFETGGELAYNFLKGDSRFAQGGVAIPLPNATVLVGEVRGEGFAQATWQPARAVTVEAALRVEVSRITQSGEPVRTRTLTYPKQHVLLTWSPSANQQARVRVEQEVGQLDFNDFAASTELALGTVSGGNADLQPQRATVVEAVYERRFWSKGVLEVTARHSAVGDVVDTLPLAGGFDAVGNIGNGTIDFAQGALTLPLDRLGLKNALLQVRANWTRSRVTDPLTGERRRFSNQEPFDCSISFSHDVKGGRYSYGIDHDCNVDRYDGFRSSEVRTTRYGPFFAVNAQYKPSSHLTLKIGLGNLTAARTRTLRDVYDGPRTIAPLLYHEDRTTRRPRYVFMDVRRVW